MKVSGLSGRESFVSQELRSIVRNLEDRFYGVEYRIYAVELLKKYTRISIIEIFDQNYDTWTEFYSKKLSVTNLATDPPSTDL